VGKELEFLVNAVEIGFHCVRTVMRDDHQLFLDRMIEG